MYDDDNSVLREAALRAERMRRDEGDGDWWMDALAQAVNLPTRNRRRFVDATGHSVATEPVPVKIETGSAAEPDSGDPERLELLRRVAARVQPGLCACGKKVRPGLGGRCPACYERSRGRRFFKFDLRGREQIMDAVKAMAARERKSVSAMISVMLAAELTRREKKAACVHQTMRNNLNT